MYALLLCLFSSPIMPSFIAFEPLHMPRSSEFIELLVDRDPEVAQLRSKVLAAEAKLESCERHLYSNDPVVVQAKADLRYIKGVWEKRRAKVRAAIMEMLQEPNGLEIVLKLYGDKKP